MTKKKTKIIIILELIASLVSSVILKALTQELNVISLFFPVSKLTD